MGVKFCSDRSDVVYYHDYNSSEQFTNKYTFNEVIGRGCYSKVKLAYDNISHKKVAVKILDKADVLKNNIYTDVRREKDILLQIQSDPRNVSPFIVPLIQCSQDFEHLYFVMEYASRGDLRQLLKQKKTLSMQKIKFISVCILLALEHLEQQSIIHGDIKPQNILIDKDGYFLLGDFSSAQKFDCSNHQIRGTKGYIAPEIKQDERLKLRDNRSDLYSLGAILWEMAHGIKYSHYKKKHNAHNKDNELTGDSSEDSQDSPIIDDDFQAFVSCLLKENPLQRPLVQQLWSHSWLKIQKQQLDLYAKKRYPNHPFRPLQDNFEYSRSSTSEYLARSKKNLFEQSDSLLSSVLLSQRRYQDLFASFSSRPNERKQHRRQER